EGEVKKILKVVSPSIVKVVAQNHKRYIATGIAIDRNHVISNMVVIRRPYETIYVKTVSGKEIPAKVVGKDRESSMILLKVEGSLVPIKRAKSFEVGDWMALVGVFYKKFPAIYQGIVSSVSSEELILNAPVAPGSSGGAVVNKDGKLMGIIRGQFIYARNPDYIFKDHSAEVFIQSHRSKEKDLCYAVPVGKVFGVANDLKKYGKVKRAWLGVKFNTGRHGHGLNVRYVYKGSPAEKAGIRREDVLLTIDGKNVNTLDEASRILKTFKPNQKMKIETLRGRTNKSVQVVLGERMPMEFKWNVRVGPKKDIDIQIPEMPESLPRLENYIFRIQTPRILGVDVVKLTP
ncbi:MAG: PDZ domain-containing protein, partial [bacterium]|nr:PDZ domain-containing protein [bacterium]